MTDFLLDTCAVLWVYHKDPLRESAASELHEAYRRGSSLCVSPITALEIATLVAKGKVAPALEPDDWFERFCELPSTSRADGLCSARLLVAAVDPVCKQLGQARDRCAQLVRPYRIMARSPMASHVLRVIYERYIIGLARLV